MNRLLQVRQGFLDVVAGNRTNVRHSRGPRAADHVPGILAAGNQQIGSARDANLFADFPMQRGRMIAQFTHVAADDDATPGRVELGEQLQCRLHGRGIRVVGVVDDGRAA